MTSVTRRPTWTSVKKAFSKHRRGMIGAIVLALVLMVAVLAPVISPYDPNSQALLKRLQPPSEEHLLGTDALGRDILSRIIHGTRYSLGVGFGAVIIGLVIGTSAGLISGYWGGALDRVLMRIIDVLMAFPGIMLALVTVAVLGPGAVNIIIALGIYSIPQYARIVRAEALSIRERDFVTGARALGGSNGHIIWRHILPNTLSPILVISTLRLAAAMLTAAALGFLGLGLPPELPEWGNMLNQGRQYLRTAPHVAISPGLAIAVTILSINLVGDLLRDILDPRLAAAG